MSEVADVGDTILKSNAAAPVLAALKDPKVARYFKSLSVSDYAILFLGKSLIFYFSQITDQPSYRPTNGPIKPEKKERHLLLSLKVPSSSHIGDTLPLIKAVFGLVDFIEGPKFALRAEVRPFPHSIALSSNNFRMVQTVRKLKASRDVLDKELLKDVTEEKAKEVGSHYHVFAYRSGLIQMCIAFIG